MHSNKLYTVMQPMREHFPSNSQHNVGVGRVTFISRPTKERKMTLVHADRVLIVSSSATGLLAGEHVRTPVHLCWTGIKDWYFADQIIAGSELVCSLEIELYNHCFLDIIEIVYYLTIDSDSNFA